MRKCLTEIQDLLKQVVGMDPVSVGSGAIEAAVRSRMSRLSVDTVEAYWEQLRASQEELLELIEMVVVPETWFFRDPDAFGILARMVTEEWLPTHPVEPIRLLSVPCSTGEEAYSMVMALLDAGFSRERIRVQAVDVSTQALARAKVGLYGSNSFRSVDLSFRDRYFRKTEKGYALLDWLSAMVHFEHKNILSAGFGASSPPFDVIFCRNLLIYFDRPTQEQVMDALRQILLPDGLLFVGPAETFLASGCGYASVNHAMSFAFRKSVFRKPRPPQPGLGPLKPRLAPRVLRKPPIGHRPLPGQVANMVFPTPASRDSTPLRTELEAIRHLADTGRSREAAELCQHYLSYEKPTSEGYCLFGLLLDSAGDRIRARDFYRKALYLEPDNVEALTHLAMLSEALGDARAAVRLRDRVQRVEKGGKKP